ncbi:hypothetical protein TNCV_770571 [Trichonephila clavipes]|nr:hypothetical protein TNCV_770571 [Trichonephila clavipes]
MPSNSTSLQFTPAVQWHRDHELVTLIPFGRCVVLHLPCRGAFASEICLGSRRHRMGKWSDKSDASLFKMTRWRSINQIPLGLRSPRGHIHELMIGRS